MRTVDQDEPTYALGKPIRPEPAKPTDPRKYNDSGTIMKDAQGKLSTNIPPPPTLWDWVLTGGKKP